MILGIGKNSPQTHKELTLCLKNKPHGVPVTCSPALRLLGKQDHNIPGVCQEKEQAHGGVSPWLQTLLGSSPFGDLQPGPGLGLQDLLSLWLHVKLCLQKNPQDNTNLHLAAKDFFSQS